MPLKITIIGTGYVSLTTAACQVLDHTIYCYGKDAQNLKVIAQVKGEAQERQELKELSQLAILSAS